MKILIAFLLLASSAFAGVQSWSNVRVSGTLDATGAATVGLSVSGSSIALQLGHFLIGGSNSFASDTAITNATVARTSGSTATITLPVNAITSGTSLADVRFGDLAADGFYSPNSDHKLYWDDGGGRWYFERVTGGLPDTDILQLNQLVNTGTLSSFALNVGDVGNEFSVDFNGNVIGASFTGIGSGLTGVIATQITGTAITNGTSTSPGLVVTKSGTSLMLSGTPISATQINTTAAGGQQFGWGGVGWAPTSADKKVTSFDGNTYFDNSGFHGGLVLSSGTILQIGSGLSLTSGTLATTGGGTVTSVAGTGAAGGISLSGTGTGAVTLVLNGTSNAMSSGTATSILLVTSTANGLLSTGTLTTGKLYASTSGSAQTISFNSMDTYFPVQVGEYSSSALTNIQTFHANPAVVGGLVTPTDFLITPKSFSTNPWAGMTLLGSSSNAWPYVEFLAGRGTLAAPTQTQTNDLIGEVAGIAVSAGGNYTVSSLIDMRVIGAASKGQIEFTITDSAGAFDQATPEFLFNATGAYLNGVIRMGDNRTLHSFTNGAQIRNANANSNLNMVRDTASNYVYTGYTPEVTFDATHPHWGTGLYASTYDYTIWTYDNSSNVKRLVITPSGAFSITGTSTLTGGAIIGTGQTVTFKSSGANQPVMTGTMASGAVTFTNTLITGTSIIIPTDIGGSVVNVGSLYISMQLSGSCTISSSNALDASTVKIEIHGGN